MKIRDDKITEEIVPILEALQRLKGADKRELYVRLEKIGNNYLIPWEVELLLVGSQSQGTLFEKNASGLLGEVKPSGPATPQLLVADVVTFTAGTADKTVAWVTVGFPKIIIFLLQHWSDVPTTRIDVDLFSVPAIAPGPWVAPTSVKFNDGVTENPAIGDDNQDIIVFVTGAAGDKMPIPETGVSMGISIVAVGGSADGSIDVAVYGSN